jgi:hypothetical protein
MTNEKCQMTNDIWFDLAGGEPLDGFLDHQSSAADGCHVKWNHAAATIAVCVVAHHTFAFGLPCWTKRKSLQPKLTVVRNFLCPTRLHQVKCGVEHVDSSGILLLQLQNLINHSIACGPIKPQCFVEAGHGSKEVEDDSASGDRTPLLNEILDTIFSDAGEHARDLDIKFRMLCDVLFDLLIDARGAHPGKRLFGTVD